MARILIQSNLDAVVPTLAPSQCNTEVNQFFPIYFSSSKHKMKYLTQLFLCKYFFWQSLKRSPLCHQVTQGLETNFEPDLVSTHTFIPQELFQEEVGTQYLVFLEILLTSPCKIKHLFLLKYFLIAFRKTRAQDLPMKVMKIAVSSPRSYDELWY